MILTPPASKSSYPLWNPSKFTIRHCADGAQTVGVEFSLADKISLTEKLDDIGFDFVEGGYPLSNDKDRSYFEK